MQGIVLLFLTTTIHSLRPQHCEDGSSSLCKTPSKLQFSILYTGITLASIGIGGLRSTITTMGANQFHNPKDQGVYFNWYFVATYLASVISSTVIVYIEDNVSWKLGFGLSVGANILGLAIFLLGTRFYRRAKPEKSPFTGIARVVVATIRKRKVRLSSESEDFYYGYDGGLKVKKVASPPTKSFR